MNTPPSMRTFVVTFLGSAAVLLALVVSFVWFMNPYGFFGGPSWPRVNLLKAEMIHHARVAKAAVIARTPMDGIIVGSSRAHRGLHPDHPGWSGRQAYNAALPGGNIEEAANYFIFATRLHPIKQAVLGVDFFMFNGYYGGTRSAASETRLQISSGPVPLLNIKLEIARSLFSIDSLVDSVAMLSQQMTLPFGPILENGLRYFRWEAQTTKDLRRYFLQTGKVHIASQWTSTEGGRFSMIQPDTGISTMSFFEKILETAHNRAIDLRIVIPPAHAWEMEFIRIAGVWDSFEQWKRDLIKANETTAQRLGKAPFPMVDFSGYNSITTNPVPGFYDTDKARKPYMDPTHFYPIVGDFMLDKLFAYHTPTRRPLADFGVWITSANIDAHLQTIRQLQARYHRTNPQDIVDIEHLLTAP